ncbi:hypothetical protein AB7849_15425 [Rhodanobacter sp. 115]|uniref:hypothetical protein n=1 Tax=Rhodanobacter sp. FW021-MT20 TaxID=1162282 RepID=UPI0034E3EA3A
MKNHLVAVVLASACVTAMPVAAQTTTGANTSITLPTPPRSMASMPVPQTAGADSTFQGNVQPNVKATTTLTVPWTYSGGSSAAAAAAASRAATVQSRPLPKRQPATSSAQNVY